MPAPLGTGGGQRAIHEAQFGPCGSLGNSHPPSQTEGLQTRARLHARHGWIIPEVWPSAQSAGWHTDGRFGKERTCFWWIWTRHKLSGLATVTSLQYYFPACEMMWSGPDVRLQGGAVGRSGGLSMGEREEKEKKEESPPQQAGVLINGISCELRLTPTHVHLPDMNFHCLFSWSLVSSRSA